MTAHPHSNQTPQRAAAYRAEMHRRRSELSGQLAALLTAPGRFVWELGCGHGHFLTAYARAHPEKLCVGIDIVAERVERALRKRDRAKLSNLHFVRAEARLFLETLPSGAAFSELFILFPDPWPKLRHHKHRIIQPGFLTAAAARAGDNCPLYFRTDHQPYYDDAWRAIDAHPAWDVTRESWPFEFTTVFQARAAGHYSLICRHGPTHDRVNAH